jgi:hypothetical protein
MGGFHTGKHVPAEYTNYWWSARARGTASQKSGYDVVTMVADADGKNATVHHGLPGRQDRSLQSPMLQMPDGAMLLSDERKRDLPNLPCQVSVVPLSLSVRRWSQRSCF